MAENKFKLKINCDASPAILFIKFFANAIQRTGCPIKLFDFPSELIRIEQNSCSAGASEVFISLYPSDAFLRFAAATLAGQFDLDLVNDFGNHKSSFSRGLR